MGGSGGPAASGRLPRLRLRLRAAVLVAAAALILAKLYLLQVVRGEMYRDMANRQHQGERSATYGRGDIIFVRRDGTEIAAATLAVGYRVAVNPSVFRDADVVCAALAPILAEFDCAAAARRLASAAAGDIYEELASRVSEEDAAKIRALKISGLGLYPERWRIYPGGSLAAHTLGFVSWQGDELAGSYGLERSYEETLVREGSGAYANFFAELFLGAKRVAEGESSPGDLVSTVEPTAQGYLEDALAAYALKWTPREAGGIVLDPSSGEIIAMAAWPTFDLNRYGDEADPAVYQNPLIERVYEMGSIMKPITMSIGIDTGAVSPETTYNDQGSLSLDGRTLYNFDKEGRGVVSMQTVLDKSLNTGVAFVVRKAGKDKFARYMKDIFGGETGVDLPEEASPLVSNLDSPRDIEYATAAFGQGVAITPLAMARGLAAVANGGYLVTPRAGRAIDYEVGAAREILPAPPPRIFAASTSETVTKMLVHVYDEALLGGRAKIPGYTMAAKTGTAQIPDGAGGYLEDRFLHSFFGYFPAYEPRFLVLLYSVEPVGAEYASQTWTEPYRDIAKFLINYFEIPPDRADGTAGLPSS